MFAATYQTAKQRWPTLRAVALPAALLVCSAAVFLIYLVPEWRAFFLSDVFVFTNGWDEEIYLSWQGILAIKSVPGFFVLNLSWVLQQLEISGAVQNLIFDTVLPPATALLVVLTLMRCRVNGARAVAYATVICFGSVLFNANNPLIKAMLGEIRRNDSLIMSGWEGYASILRTPNPEVPFFLIACAVYAFARYGRWCFLLLPLPLLYYHTAVPYIFLLMLVAVYRQFRLRFSGNPVAAIGAASAATFVAMGIALAGLSYLEGLYQPDNEWRNSAYVFSITRQPQIPVGLMVLAALFSGGLASGVLRVDRRLVVPSALVAIACFGAVNLHVVTGFMLSQKNYYDYGLSILLALLTVIAIDSIRFDVARSAALVVVLLAIASLSYQSQQYWFQHALKLSEELSPQMDEVRLDPLHAIIPDVELSAHVAYAIPRLLSPLSNLYWVRPINAQCSGTVDLVANATAYVKQRFPGDGRFSQLLECISRIEKVGQPYPATKPDASFCRGADFESKGFYLPKNSFPGDGLARQ